MSSEVKKSWMSAKVLLFLVLVFSMVALSGLSGVTIGLANADSSNGITAQYLLDSDSGSHLTDSGWCAVQGKHLSWPTAISTCDEGGGVLPFAFDKAKNSYVIFKDLEQNPQLTDGAGHNLKTNRYTMYIAASGKKMTAYKGVNPAHPEAGQQYYLTSSATFYKVTLIAEPNDDPDYKYNWTGSYANLQYYSAFIRAIDPSAISGYMGVLIGNDQQAAQVGAVNLSYANSWDMAAFTNHVPYGDDEAANCSTLDIGCWLGRLTTGFTNGIKSLVGLFVDMFNWLFVPPTDQIHTAFDSFNAWMTNKLGFLSYPFTFIGSVFAAFTSSSGWCNASSCSKDFGNLFGHDFNVNLGQMQTTMPSVWLWFVSLIRGITILVLLLSVRAKLRRVTEA